MSVPSLTMYIRDSPRGSSTLRHAVPFGGHRGTFTRTGPEGILSKHWRMILALSLISSTRTRYRDQASPSVAVHTSKSRSSYTSYGS